MPFGTASAKLRKNILFELIVKCGLDNCFQCGAKIKSVNELSIEHKVPYLDSEDPVKLFFDIDNIAFSHLKCNVGSARQTKTLKHPSQESYKRGCRCGGCLLIQKNRMQVYRSNKLRVGEVGISLGS